jgi:hypothetical protein
MKRKNLLSLALALLTAIALSIAFAAVFSYYPVSITISPVSPPVYFAEGENANQDDLGAGNTIAVNVGSSSTSVSITIHPTYQVTYYKNVTLIVNNDTKAYNIYLRVATAASLPSGASAVVYVYSKGASRSLSGYPPTPTPSGYVKSVDLTSTGTTYIGSLSGGSAYEIDIYVYIPEGTSPSSTTAKLLLIASPSSESPP